jgi:hypothetical protein
MGAARKNTGADSKRGINNNKVSLIAEPVEG